VLKFLEGNGVEGRRRGPVGEGFSEPELDAADAAVRPRAQVLRRFLIAPKDYGDFSEQLDVILRAPAGPEPAQSRLRRSDWRGSSARLRPPTR